MGLVEVLTCSGPSPPSPKSLQRVLGAGLKAPTVGAGVCPLQQNHLPAAESSGGISGACWGLWSMSGAFPQTPSLGQAPGIHQEVLNLPQPLQLPEGPRGLHHLVRGDAGDVDRNGDDSPGKSMLLQGASDHVPVPAQQEERWDVRRAPGAVLDHLDVEAVVLIGVIRDDDRPPAVLLDHPRLRQERAAPGAHSDKLWWPHAAPCQPQDLQVPEYARRFPKEGSAPQPCASHKPCSSLRLYFRHRPPTLSHFLLRTKSNPIQSGFFHIPTGCFPSWR